MASASTTFNVTLIGDSGKVGFIVPAESIEALGGGQRPPVSVDLNGHVYRYTVAVMGGQHAIGVSKAIRDVTGLKAGDNVKVALTLDTSPRDIGMPDDFAAALQKAPKAKTFFDGLSNSLQRYHVGNVEGAKTTETRERRIAKAIELFLAGKQR